MRNAVDGGRLRHSAAALVDGKFFMLSLFSPLRLASGPCQEGGENETTSSVIREML